ncbi:SDR family oxidoreductase [bacterium]|nr:SDR family oxidoreductase [bacterium]
MKKIFITGASGLVGSNLAKLSSDFYEVYGFYNQNKPNFPKVTWIKCNLENLDFEKHFLEIKPNFCFHFAGLSKVNFCEENPKLTEIVNVLATEKIAKICEKIGCKLIFASTDLVFDGTKKSYTEKTETNPLSIYGKSKLEAERKVSENCKNSVVARFSLVFGKNSFSFGENFSEFLVKSFKNSEKVKVFFDQTRATISAKNLVECLLELAENEFKGLMILAGNKNISRVEFAERIAEILKLNKKMIVPTKTEEILDVKIVPLRIKLDNSLAKKILNTKILEFEEGIVREFLPLNCVE